MPTAQRFEDLQVWQEARALVLEVHRTARRTPFVRDLSLRDQITRAAVSTMSNIAEGFERGSRKEFLQFLYVAKGSNGEVRSQLCVAHDLEYIDRETHDRLTNASLALSRRLAKFIGYLKSYPGNSRVRIAKTR